MRDRRGKRREDMGPTWGLWAWERKSGWGRRKRYEEKGERREERKRKNNKNNNNNIIQNNTN